MKNKKKDIKKVERRKKGEREKHKEGHEEKDSRFGGR